MCAQKATPGPLPCYVLISFCNRLAIFFSSCGMNIFYCPTAVLNEYCVFDGNGSLFNARIDAIGKKEVTIHLVRLIEKELNGNPKLHIAIAPPKNIERLEWFAEKVAEIGVNEITPVLCKHSERRELRID